MVVKKWDGSGTEPASKYIFFYRKRNENLELGTILCMRELYQPREVARYKLDLV
jgi:hypothetical protein